MMTTMSVVGLGGLLILGVATAAAGVLRGASASLRHRIWLAAACAALALPFLDLSGVELRVPLPAVVEAVVEEGLSRTAAAASPTAPRSEMSARSIASRSGSSGATVAVKGGPAAVAAQSASSAAVVGSISAGADAPSGKDVTPGKGAEPGKDAAPGKGAATPRWELGMLAVWATGALLLLSAALLAQARAWLLTTSRVAPAPPSTRRRLQSLARALGVEREVRVVVSREVGVPATWGLVRPTVVLPPDHGTWSSGTLDRVLVHELAHVRRGDSAAYLLSDLMRVVHWPNPLAWLAVRRIRVESDRASDDRVVEVLSGPGAYARDLLSLLRSARRGGALPGAAVAMARPGGMSARVRAILDPGQSRAPAGVLPTALIGALAVALALSATVVTPVVEAQERDPSVLQPPEPEPEAEEVEPTRRSPEALKPSPPGVQPQAAEPVEPTSQEAPCVFRDDERRSMSTNVDEDEIRIRWETDDCRVEIDMEGEVAFSSDDRRIVALAPDALFDIEERVARSTRRARLEGRSGGGMERRYWEDGDELAWSAEADAWLGRLLPEIFRQTTINAEARVQRMLEEGGPDRVFAEADRIVSDHVSRRYLELLMEQGDLDDGDYRSVIAAAADIDSDHASAKLLMAVVERAGLQPGFRDPLLEAARRIDSDHQKARVLETLLASSLSASQLDDVLATTASIDSDHQRARILQRVARDYPLTGGQTSIYLRSAADIDSDHQKAETARAVLERSDVTPEHVDLVLAIARDIDSDHQRADVLQDLSALKTLTPSQRSDLLRNARGIHSDHQLARVLTVVSRTQELGSTGVEEALQTVGAIDSSHQRAVVLLDLAERYEIEGDARRLYLELAESLSRHDRARAVEAVAR